MKSMLIRKDNLQVCWYKSYFTFNFGIFNYVYFPPQKSLSTMTSYIVQLPNKLFIRSFRTFAILTFDFIACYRTLLAGKDC